MCRLWFNTMKLQTFDPNLHLSLTGATFCLLSWLFVLRLLACFFASLLAMPIMLIHFMPFHMLFASFPSIARLLASCLFLCMYTHGARIHGARSRSSRCKQKGRGCEYVDISQAAVFSRFRVQLFPLVMYYFKPLSSSSLSFLDGLYQVYHVVYHLSSSLEYDDPCLLSCTYTLGHGLGMQAFTFLLCVLELCMMYVYIYLFPPTM